MVALVKGDGDEAFGVFACAAGADGGVPGMEDLGGEGGHGVPVLEAGMQKPEARDGCAL